MKGGRSLDLAVRRLGRQNLAGTWYRIVPSEFANAPLAAGHSKRTASRFNAGPLAVRPFEILYFADTPLTALYETRTLFGDVLDPIPNPRVHAAISSFAVRLEHAADLTAHPQLIGLRTSHQELMGNWKAYRPPAPNSMPHRQVGVAPTQALGQAIHDSGRFGGWIYPSTQLVGSRCLAVLTQRLNRRSEITLSA